jgi:hypothetical protein
MHLAHPRTARDDRRSRPEISRGAAIPPAASIPIPYRLGISAGPLPGALTASGQHIHRPSHIQHILRKLGVRSRTELDALLLRPQTSRVHEQLRNRVGPVSLPGFPPAIRLNITDSGDC